MSSFQAIPTDYDPLRAGSIDGTDADPHDNGIVRALNAKYKPNKGVRGNPECTVFVGRLNHSTTEETLEEQFKRYGNIEHIRLIRDIVTGFSQGYAFVEYTEPNAACRASIEANKIVIDDKEIMVDMECERTMPGWVPRRLGGGLGGRKESGQLRFGGRDRPFKKPIMLHNAGDSERFNNRDRRRSRSRERRDDWRRRDHSRDDDHRRMGRSRERYSRY
ncbi:hypothetical protein CAPTEDRAFT_133662 [Capitella teleta]|uniref:U11/U12 small nuclear ribonucleoprotein 35 kDa protein n=1 Tax=Capitella teleta TaxID=283909 RepID=R7U916_CAPTE|nr:hypothetical protein CAPTEDRAFT_133662 [Capitella teleta]|eukprot:ELU02850.1 hypothetical protein CAPTEDRAFT_133662 [Capitella teleta]